MIIINIENEIMKELYRITNNKLKKIHNIIYNIRY